MWILKNLEGAVHRICPRNSWFKVTGGGPSFELGPLGYGAPSQAARNDVRLLKFSRIVLGRLRMVLGLYLSCNVGINLFFELRNTPGSYVTGVGRAMPTSGRFDGTPLNGTVSRRTQYELMLPHRRYLATCGALCFMRSTRVWTLRLMRPSVRCTDFISALRRTEIRTEFSYLVEQIRILL